MIWVVELFQTQLLSNLKTEQNCILLGAFHLLTQPLGSYLSLQHLRVTNSLVTMMSIVDDFVYVWLI